MDIVLTGYDNYTVTVNKDNIIELFPNSLLGTIISLDKSVELIPLTNPIITPNILNILAYIINNKTLPIIPSDPEYAIASRYLLIEALGLLSDPDIAIFLKTYLDINLLDAQSIYDNLNVIGDFISANRDKILLRYLFHMIPYDILPDEMKYDSLLCDLVGIIRNGEVKILQIYLQYGVDPSQDNNIAITIATRGNNIEVLDLLLADPRVNPSTGFNKPLLNALSRGHIEMANRILDDPRFNPRINQDKLLQEAYNHSNIEILWRLLSNPRIIPTEESITIANEMGWITN